MCHQCIKGTGIITFDRIMKKKGNITVPTGTARELAPSEILAADSTDYLLGGTLTMKNGRIERYLFDEGYCQASKVPSNPAKDKFVFYYYDRDHLGSVRQVIIANGTDKGTVAQKMNYYPSGLQFCNSTTDSDVQSRRYNGKELDRMHGLNTYDYGARQYNPVTARWDRPDPLSEKYYSISPYAYCANDPVRFVDPDGKLVDEPHGKNKWPNISPVIPQNKFVGWNYRNITNCLDLAKRQIGIVGYTAGGAEDPTNIYPYNESKGVNQEQAEKAVNYMKDALEQGIPVIIGVDDKDGSPNKDNTTDHFLVVVGMGNDDNGNYFRVYDNATSNITGGTNPDNKLYYNPETYKIEGNKQFDNPYSQEVRRYIVSQVRISRKKEQKTKNRQK